MNIVFNKVEKRWSPSGRKVVDDVSMSVPSGAIFALIGASGAGKSTLLRMPTRLVVPDSGDVLVGGRCVMEYDAIDLRRSVAFVPQDYGLMEHLSVEENAALGLRALGQTAAERRKRVHEMLFAVGLDPAEYSNRRIHEISGGQRQRVAIARSLALVPRVLLLDEPFAALDSITRREIGQKLLEMRRRRGLTVFMVTHDVREAFLLADIVGVMHDGRLEQIGAPQSLIDSPKTPYVKNIVACAAMSSFAAGAAT